jgi:phospholipid/cholesterol/gamma-HCH transport system substrate-binding protein
MKPDDNARQLRAGLLVIAALGLMVAAVFVLGRSQALFTHRVHLHTSFDNSSGLVVGTPVRLAGVDVGIVESIRFDSDLRQKKVRIALAVDRRYLGRIREDSVARLASKGLLGDMIINISVGSAEAAPLRDGDTLRSQESDGLTEVVASLQDGIAEIRALSGSVKQRVETVFTDQLGRDLGRTVHAAADIAENLERGHGLAHALVYDRRLARKADQLLDDTQDAARAARSASQRVDRILATVEHGPGTVHGLVYQDDGTRVLRELLRVEQELSSVVGEIKSGRGLLHSLIYEKERSNLLENLTALSQTLRQLGDEVQAGKGTVGALLKDPSVYEDLKTILGNIKRNRLLRFLIRSTIKKDGLKAP